ncbi:TonB-dependent receptor [Sphingomonas sp. HT-1]|uniref:TonB-dependent receptor n=1 Tax=unclassified Sphingomonas TaxID=196159 RepID=UPI0003195A53|nr:MULTISPECIES: TonB-dependent receptor [unclassified Sphingomonas]KTF69828.1 TonB-dependent receptor [Sphingomonas sp. WG]
MSKSALLVSAAVMAVLAAPAGAQDLRGSAADAKDAAEAPPPNSADIVVTATRRSERLSNVPIAVSAFSQLALQNSGATDIRQMTQLAPSLLVSSTGSEANAAARIRGIGTVGDNPGLESSVAVFIDGIYRSRTGSGLNDLGEIERIEVLRGPQGTLSGRNSSAGAISIYTKLPEFQFGGFGEVSYGNYNAVRLSGALTGPIVSEAIAFRLDGVYSKRDGFLRDVVNNTDYNDRNRVFVRGQLLFKVNPDLAIRLIADYTRRDEKCCGAAYVDTAEKLDATPGTPGDFATNPAGNRVTAILRSMGGVLPSEGDPYNRRIAFTPGRAYSNLTTDYGISSRVRWNIGDTQLTSLTAYREYKSGGAADIDYGNLDLVYRPNDGNSYRQFHTFTHESRFSGTIFGDKLDWLVGGYYAHEKLQVADNLRFGAQYGAFAACRMVATLNPAAALRDPSRPGCLSALGRAALTPAVGPQIIGGIDRLSTLNDRGSVRDLYDQTSNNWALFTHNIYRFTDRFNVTLGLRYTREAKSLAAGFNNNNTICPAQQAALAPLLRSTNATLQSLAGALVTLSCTGNSSSAITGLALNDRLKEGQLTGTGVLSWKVNDDTLVYGSYARGYKAGGYNLDRSDLTATVFGTPVAGDVRNLRFDPETVNAYELGLKYSAHKLTANVALYRSEFTNFQLNTFNGTNFIVQNIGGCSTSLNGTDRDNSSTTGACTGKVGKGVVTQGVELEVGLTPTHDFSVNLGYTLADAKYRRDLVGSKAGEPLNAALFLLSGSQMSNAPRHTVTSAVTWTPALGGSGLTGLLYVDGRLTSDYNTGSDLFAEKLQDGFFLMNARIGVRGKDERWALELWAQNLLDTNYQQVAFNLPFQGAGSRSQVQAFGAPAFATANTLFGSFLAEPRTYGLTLRSRF